MTRLPELHRQLVQAVARAEADERHRESLEAQIGRSRLLGFAVRARGQSHSARRSIVPRLGSELRRLRAPLLALVALLASATIALAATGVIEIGSSVQPRTAPKPRSGVGAPIRSEVRLLSLRVPDPAGGLPWGVRIVPTTRGTVCLQIGRVENGELGELGVDGAFHDDGKFHPLSIDALPEHEDSPGSAYAPDTTCQLAGTTRSLVFTYALSAASVPRKDEKGFPTADMRSVAVGVLGPEAVSVTYRAEGGEKRTQRVVSRYGVYLVVKRAKSHKTWELGMGGGTSGISDRVEMAAQKPLTAITYRIDGRLCESTFVHVADRCRRLLGGALIKPRYVDLHEHLHAHLIVTKHVVTGVEVSFKAPFAVRSSRQDYEVSRMTCRNYDRAHGGLTFNTLERDVRRGETVSLELAYPFEETCTKGLQTIEVRYRKGRSAEMELGPGWTIVGKVELKQPSGTEGIRPSRRGR